MRILLTGSTGRLGGAFLSIWRASDSPYHVRALTRDDLDLSLAGDELKNRLHALWSSEAFDAITNPAAISGLEECLDQPDLAQAVNVVAPRAMAEFCEEKEIPFVHFSTDYVFGGNEAERKSESAEVGAINVYGKSKQRGEMAVLTASPHALVCRVSWLFGPAEPNRKSHFDNVLERAMAGDLQHLIGDKYSIPTFTHDVVSWVELLLARQCSGIYHLCNAGEPESWMSYARKVCDLAQPYGYTVKEETLLEVSIAEATYFRDSRPVHTAMLPDRLIDEGIVTPRHWLDAAKEYLEMR